MAKSGQTSVYTGPLFLPKEQIMKFMLIGKSELAVPTNFFKIAIVEYLNDIGEINYWIEAFVLPNEFNELMIKEIEKEISLYKLKEKLPEFVFNCRNAGYKINQKENSKRINIHNLIANYSESVDFIEQNSEFRILTKIKKAIKNLKGGHKFHKDKAGEFQIIKEKVVEEKYRKEELENLEDEHEEDEVLENISVKETNTDKLKTQKTDKLYAKNDKKKKEDKREKRVSLVLITSS
ncbi:unnamed protein product [Meloidogyne enterolobii]|uniref:Uncharacterized protein n=1 Tax=Meloidogyne enterolobii TaxID=390850 RepID=A0ACB0XS75_MELEN